MTDRKEDENLGSFYMGRTRPPPEPQRVLPRGFLSAIAVLGFIGLIWYAYPQGQEKYTDVDVPVITADTASYKFKPAEPGGMDVPHRDSTVFDTIDKKAPAKAEKITSKKEEPLDRKALGLDEKKPKLNLEPEMKPEPEKKEAAATPAPKAEPKAEAKAESKKEEPKAAEKPAEEKEQPRTASVGAYIQLGAYKSEAEAKSEWARLKKKYAPLDGLAMRLQDVTAGGKTLHRLQAGVMGAAEAKSICDVLKKDKAACILVK